MKRFYEQINPPELSCKTTNKLLNLAVSKTLFKYNGLWACAKKNGLIMGASLAVPLADSGLKEYEPNEQSTETDVTKGG